MQIHENLSLGQEEVAYQNAGAELALLPTFARSENLNCGCTVVWIQNNYQVTVDIISTCALHSKK